MKKKRHSRQQDSKAIIVQVSIDDLPDKARPAFQKAIDLIKRYELPCDVAITDLDGTTARHVWRKDGTCEIRLSFVLIANGDAKSVHRRIIHEAAHHIAGLEHGHDEHFRRVCSDMYAKEGYPPGKPGDHCGNINTPSRRESVDSRL